MVSEHLKLMLLNCKKQKISDVLGDDIIIMFFTPLILFFWMTSSIVLLTPIRK